MEKVLGIGGLFFRCQDPTAQAAWYERHLGITSPSAANGYETWRQEAGETALTPFPADTKYFGDERQNWMVNFRVRDLDAMVAQLREAGIEVEVNPETFPYGRFAKLQDPEGNPIELWQPADED